jgi:hypothetical protein
MVCNQDVSVDVTNDKDDGYDIINNDESLNEDSIKSGVRNEEFGLTGITFPMSRALLSDLNVLSQTWVPPFSTPQDSSWASKMQSKEPAMILS